MVYPHKERVVISSFSDVQKISPASKVCFRKFISKRLFLEVLKRSENLRKIEISKSAYSRCNKDCIEILKSNGIEVKISRNKGRPSLVEMMIW